MSRVLVVDDEESIRLSFEKILTDAGHHVFVSADTIEAKTMLETHAFDVAVIDRILGAHNGMEIVKTIHETQPLCSTLLISGFPSFKSASEGFQYNVVAYLTKPVRKDQLKQAVEDAAKKSRKRRMVKQLEKQLIREQRMETLGLLAGGIVKKFNHLLTVVNGYIDLTLLEIDGEGPLMENLETVRKETDKGLVISTHILSYIHQNEEGKTLVPIEALVLDTLELVKLTLPETIVLDSNIAEGESPVSAFPAQIQQVIMNLCNRAEFSMKEIGGRLRISLALVSILETLESDLPLDPGDYIKISIHDTGTALDTEEINQLFQSDVAAIPHSSRMDFSLAVSLKIAQNHGGTITVESTPGLGNGYYFYLPAINKE